MHTHTRMMGKLTQQAAIPPVDFLEVFSGKGAVSRVFANNGHAVAAIDIEKDKSMDLASPWGMASSPYSHLHMACTSQFGHSIITPRTQACCACGLQDGHAGSVTLCACVWTSADLVPPCI